MTSMDEAKVSGYISGRRKVVPRNRSLWTGRHQAIVRQVFADYEAERKCAAALIGMKLPPGVAASYLPEWIDDDGRLTERAAFPEVPFNIFVLLYVREMRVIERARRAA